MNRLPDSLLEKLDAQGFTSLPDFVTGERLNMLRQS